MPRALSARVRVVPLALLVAMALPASGFAAHSTGSNTAQWCAAVIKTNTRFGTMKNKHYIRSALNSPSVQKALVTYTVKHKAQILAITPAQIKTAMSHELTFYANLVANGFKRTTPLAPFSPADSKRLLDFQHAHCGITGP